jgi:hypothetical protein
LKIINDVLNTTFVPVQIIGSINDDGDSWVTSISSKQRTLMYPLPGRIRITVELV